MLKGLIISIYHPPGGDCNSTITREHGEALLVGPNIPKIFEADGRPVLLMDSKKVFGEVYYFLRPADQPGPFCFGGNLGYCSDSRFPHRYPLKIHDGSLG